MNHTVLSRAAEVTLEARLRGQFAALRFAASPPDAAPDEVDDHALLMLANPGQEPPGFAM